MGAQPSPYRLKLTVAAFQRVQEPGDGLPTLLLFSTNIAQLGFQLLQPLITSRVGVGDGLPDGGRVQRVPAKLVEDKTFHGVSGHVPDPTALVRRLRFARALVVEVLAAATIAARRGHHPAALAPKQPFQQVEVASALAPRRPLLVVLCKKQLDAVESLTVDERRPIAVDLVAVANLATCDIAEIAEHYGEAAVDERTATAFLAVFRCPRRPLDALLRQRAHKPTNRADLQVFGENEPGDPGAIGFVDEQRGLVRFVRLVTERHLTAEPFARCAPHFDLFLRALRGPLALQLREDQDHVQHRPPGRAGCLHVVAQGDELDLTLFKGGQKAVKVDDAACDAVELRHTHDVEFARPHVGKKTLELWSVGIFPALSFFAVLLDDHPRRRFGSLRAITFIFSASPDLFELRVDAGVMFHHLIQR